MLPPLHALRTFLLLEAADGVRVDCTVAGCAAEDAAEDDEDAADLDKFGGHVLDLVASGVLNAPHPPTPYGEPDPYKPDEFALGVMFGAMFGPIFGYGI